MSETKGQKIVAGAMIVGFAIVIGALASIPTIPRTNTTAATGAPAYCATRATERLPECGGSDEQQRKLDAADAQAAESRADFYRGLARAAKASCDKPVGQMSPGEIEDCNKPVQRMLRK